MKIKQRNNRGNGPDFSEVFPYVIGVVVFLGLAIGFIVSEIYKWLKKRE